MPRNAVRAIILPVVALASISAGTASASVLYYEGFDYAPGPVNTAGTAWDHLFAPSVTTPTFDSGSLSYPLLATTGNHLAQNDAAGSEFPYTVNNTAPVNSMFSSVGTYYYTLLGQIQTDVDGIDGLGTPVIYSNPAFSEGFIQLAAQANGGNEIVYQMEAGGAGGSTFVQTPSAVHVGTFMLAVKVVNDGTAANDQVYFVANPDLGQSEAAIFASPTLSVTNRNITSSVSADALIYFARNHRWDELRIATTWAEAAPAVPEPASFALLSIGGLALLGRRR